MSQQLQLALKRFLKAFLAGGIAAVVTLFSSGTTFSNNSDLKKLGLAILTGFISGGIMGVEKYISSPNVPPVPNTPPQA